ncbi:ABC transporter substrate-binding protein [Amycolatopsis pithecellobii]|uniref:PhnD/SsuA/transferrin family substrate-binding protein n=1 Tax=Amycolatopsis pithecellobii TaxID=664692 RepID=A0A6N7YZS5_9PSEU|nr:ABC transporter substrate-binding protein [Amycolatopsis pithecellobii]MTD57442.1 PhnD/SsuA/transferrin family substrate-binding protein [Amycolatopsis pithecellobii]
MTKRPVREVALVAMAFALAACGATAGPTDEGNGASDGSPGKAGTIKVGVSPTLSATSLYQAMGDGGQLKDAGITVTTEPITSGPQAIPLLLNGQTQITSADPMSVAVAISKNVPIEIVAQGAAFADRPELDATALVTKAGGPARLTDLKNAKVAVVGLNTISQLGIQAAVDSAGGDSSTINVVELPLPNMVDAVNRGQVAAALIAEPFLSSALQVGLRPMANPLSEQIAGVGQLVYVATKKWAAANPDAVRGFATAMKAANEQLAAGPEQIRKIGARITQLTPAQLGQIRLPNFTPSTVDVDKLQGLIDQMVKYHYLSSSLKASSFVNPAATARVGR